MVSDQVKESALSFLKTKVVAVLATLNENGNPSAATIYFAVDDDFNFYFVTKVSTKKYQNLKKHKKVALVVGTENLPTTVQIEGEATELEELDKKAIALDKVARNSLKGIYGPPLNKMEPGDLAVFKVSPTWMSFLDQTDASGQYNDPIQVIP